MGHGSLQKLIGRFGAFNFSWAVGPQKIDVIKIDV
jgi:hypothetical protein